MSSRRARRQIRARFHASRTDKFARTSRLRGWQWLEQRLMLTNTWSGTIPNGTIWDSSQVQQIIGNIDVPAGSTLTIKPGTIVQFNTGSQLSMTIDGTLDAMGTAASPIQITSANGSQGDWSDISFSSTSSGSVLDHVNITGGGSGVAGEVLVNAGQLTLTNSLIGNSSAAGMRLVGANPVLGGDTFQDNNGAAVSSDLASHPAITSATVTNNNVNGLLLDSGTLPGNAFWDNAAMVYQLNGDVTVPQGDTLTVGAGQIVKVPYENNSDDNLLVNGTLSATGTAAQPIIFTSYRDDSAGGDTNNDGPSGGASGDWHDIRFSNTSTDNVLDNVEVRYSGGGATVGVLIDDGATLTLSNSTVSNNFNGPGVRIIGANPKIINDTFQNNNGPAIESDLASQPVINGITFANNNVNGVLIDSGTLSANATWNNPTVVYQLAGDVTVPQGVTLTVGAGQIVKVPYENNSDDNLLVNGTLSAMGTAAQPIIFTSYRDDSAGGDTNNDGPSSGSSSDWHDIRFSNTSTNNVLNNVEVRYSGGGATVGVLIDDGAALTLSNSTISNNYNGPGLRILGANPKVTNVTFQDNNGPAIESDLASQPVINGITAINNSVNGLSLDGGTLPANATWDNPTVVYQLASTITVPQGVTLTVGSGQIIKAPYRNDALIVNGTLDANGTAAAPIIFTSFYDDTAGGDTDNGGPSVGNSGDWHSIEFTSTSTGSMLNHIEARYGGDSSDGTLGMINVTGATLTLSNSVIRDSGHCAIDANSGSSLTLTNCLLVNNSNGAGVQGEATATLNVINCTIDGNAHGVILDSPNTTLTNDLITNNGSDGIEETGPTTLTMSYCDVYNPGATNYNGLTDQTNTNGNLSANPDYFNQPGGQYELVPGSPAEDAGTKTGTPTTDFFGNPRFKDPNITGRGDGSGYDIGAIEVEKIATSRVDLAATAVSGPATGLEGQSVTVNWTIAEVGADTATGSWYDAVYLSASPVFTPGAILLGEVQHTGDLGSGSSYSASGTFTLPGVLPGNYYYLVRANSHNDVFEGTALSNNVIASTATVAMDLPALTLGTALTGQLPATGASELFKVTMPAGSNLDVALTGASGNTNELYLAYGDLPTSQSFLDRGIRAGSANQSVSVTGTQAGTYYILVYGASLSAVESFTLKASAAGFSLSGVSPAQGSNTGQVTIAISGAEFNNKSQPQLVDSAGVTVKPLHVYYTDSGLISATFDLTGLPTGSANVQVVDGSGVTHSLSNGFNIVSGPPGNLVTSLVVPSAVRLGRGFEVTVDYSNTGDTDIPAPIMSLTASSTVDLSFSPNFANPQSDLDLVGVNPTGPAGVLPPGAQGQITVYGTDTAAGSQNFQLAIGQYPATAIDWSAIGPLIKPASVWDPLFAQIQQDIGPTWNLYQQVVSTDATLLPAGLGMNYSLGDVLQLEVAKAEAKLNPSVSGQLFVNDTSHPLGNVALQLYDSANQQYAQTVSLTDGSFLLPNLPAGTYAVTLSGYVPTGTGQLTMSTASQSGVQIVAAPAAELTGSVVQMPGGAPVVGITVAAVSETTGFTALGTTDSNGQFVIGSLPADTYDVSAGGGALTQQTVTGLTLSAGQSLANVDLALASGGTIRGTVTGPSGAVAGAQVTATGADGTGFSAVSASDGTYAISGLGGQVYTVSAIAPGLVPTDKGNITLAAGGIVSGVNLSLSKAGSLTGKLTSSVDGSPMASVVLALVSGSNSFSAVSDANGDISVTNLPPGVYTISTSASTAMTTSTKATVTAGSNTSFNLTVAPLGQVSGTITNATTGKPLANVVVYAATQSGVVTSTVTATDGTYQLTGLDAGSYQVIVGDQDSPGVASTSITLSSSQTTATANLNVSVAGIVSGTVFQANGSTPISGAQVALAQAGALLQTTTTDQNGNYSFILVAAGTFRLEATSAGLAFPAISSVALSGGAVVTGRNFVAGKQVLSGVAQDAGTSQPIAGATVTVSRADTGIILPQVGTLTTATDGSFKLTGLVPGSYDVVLQAAGYALSEQTLTVTSGTPTTVTFKLAAGSTLQGTIRDDGTHQPLTGAIVTLLNAGDFVSTSSSTDATGGYEFGSLPAGTYSLVVNASGYEAADIQNLAVGQGANTFNVALAVSNTVVSGTVKGGSSALGLVQITATDANGVVVMATSSTFDGKYQLDGLPPGSYQLVATAAGYTSSAPVSVTVTAGQTASNVNFTLSAISLSDPTAQPASAVPAGDYSWAGVFVQGPPANAAPTVQSLGTPPDPTAPNYQDYQAAVAAIGQANHAYETWSTYWAAESEGNLAQLVSRIGNDYLNFVNALDQLGVDIHKLGVAFQLFITAVKAGDFKGASAYLKILNAETLNAQGGPFRVEAGTDPDITKVNNLANALNDDAFSLGDLAAKGSIYFQLQDDYNTALTAAIQAIAAYLPTQAGNSPPGGTLSTVLTGIGIVTVVGAPVVQIPPPDEPPESTFNPVQNEPIAAPVAQPGSGATQNVGGAFDPNNLIGPSGFGSKGFVQPGTFSYDVEFENDPAKATAAAQIVTATLPLSSNLNASTFQFTGFGFGSHNFTVPPGLTHYQTTVDLRPDGIDLLVPVTLDLAQGVVTAEFQSLDPATMLPPDGLNDGFLPLDDANHDGEGYFTFSAAPKAGLTTGKSISEQASIVFDTNNPLSTPTATNTLDVGAPTSSVATLPAESTTSFTVKWSGSDDTNGSGIAFYDVFVSDNGGAFTAFQTATTATSATFTGVVGHTYSFYSVATDNVGNRQPTPAAAQAKTTVAADTIESPLAVSISPTEGKAFSGTVATFKGSTTTGTTADFTATIVWGDGATTAGAVKSTAAAGYSVTGSHTYAEETAAASFKVFIRDSAGKITTLAHTVKVADAPLTAKGTTFAQVEGATFNSILATFTDADPNGTLADYTATITWGDGTTSAGTIAVAAHQDFVIAKHVYAEEGTYAVKVTIADSGGSKATVTSSAEIFDAAVKSKSQTITATKGVAFSGKVATFTDADPKGTLTDFTATIVWGDGTTTAGNITTVTGGGFAVTGTHTYAASGTETVTVTITDSGGSRATAKSTAKIGNPAAAVAAKDAVFAQLGG